MLFYHLVPVPTWKVFLTSTMEVLPHDTVRRFLEVSMIQGARGRARLPKFDHGFLRCLRLSVSGLLFPLYIYLSSSLSNAIFYIRISLSPRESTPLHSTSLHSTPFPLFCLPCSPSLCMGQLSAHITCSSRVVSETLSFDALFCLHRIRFSLCCCLLRVVDYISYAFSSSYCLFSDSS